MFLNDINAKETSDQPLILAQVDRKPAKIVAGVPPSRAVPSEEYYMSLLPESRTLSKGVCQKMCIKSKRPMLAQVNPWQDPSRCFRPISAILLTRSVFVVSCKEKALLEACLALNVEGKQTNVPCVR